MSGVARAGTKALIWTLLRRDLSGQQQAQESTATTACLCAVCVCCGAMALQAADVCYAKVHILVHFDPATD
jgi:hypothetical protein